MTRLVIPAILTSIILLVGVLGFSIISPNVFASMPHDEKATEKALQYLAIADKTQAIADTSGTEKDQQHADKKLAEACKEIQKDIDKLVLEQIAVPAELQTLYDTNCV